MRWSNIDKLGRDGGFWNKNSLQKLIAMENRKSEISRGSYYNPNIGDLTNDLHNDIFKCQYW